MLKTISSITNALGALNYKGTWNALTNTPTLADGTGAKGDYYVTSTAGTQTFGGLLLFFGIGDWIAYNGAVWQRVEGGSDGNFANITLNSTDAGASAAPLLDLYRDSASPAASDTLGEIEFNGEDSAGNKQQYALIHASILSPTSGSETGQLHFETATGGASTEKMIIGTSNLVINEIGAVFNVRIEGDTDANLFFTDATNSKIGVGTITPLQKLDVSSTANEGANVSLTKTNSGTPDQNGQVLFFNNSHAAGTGRTAGVKCGQLVWQFSQPSSGALQFAGEIAVLAETQGGASTASSLNLYSSGGRGITIDSGTIVSMPAYGAGAATFSASGVISSVSDETWKTKDGVPVNTDAMLQKLEPGYWFYNEEKAPIFGQDRQLGFYAQNVREAIGSEAAPTPEEGKPWGYYDRSVLAVTVMSLKNALSTIEELKQRIVALESK